LFFLVKCGVKRNSPVLLGDALVNVEAVTICCDTQGDLGDKREALVVLKLSGNRLACEAGNPAPVHALMAETAEPTLSASAAQVSSKGALGPTELDHEPQIS